MSSFNDKFALPEWDAMVAKDKNDLTPLEEFIINNTPAGSLEEREWRETLVCAIESAIIEYGAADSASGSKSNG